MTGIYVLTGVNFHINCDKLHTATFGLFDKFETAEALLKLNVKLLNEGGMFIYFIIEKYDICNIYPTAEEVQWYRINGDKAIKWSKPENLKHICNFGIS